MTDEEIVREIAEKVMGWSSKTVRGAHDDFPVWIIKEADLDEPFSGTSIAHHDYNPLVNEAHCAAVLEKMAEIGWSYAVRFEYGEYPQNHEKQFNVAFWQNAFQCYPIESPDRKRAICLAALKAASDA